MVSYEVKNLFMKVYNIPFYRYRQQEPYYNAVFFVRGKCGRQEREGRDSQYRYWRRGAA
jgi:hypothetical protein